MHLSVDHERWPRWLELLTRVRQDVPTLVDEFMDRVKSVPSYEAGLVPVYQLRADAARIFVYLLLRMGDDRRLDKQAALAARQLGVSRARAGVPLGDLLTAVHLDSQVLWEALKNRTSPGEHDLLVAAVDIIWSAVEDYSANVQRGYAEEEARASARTLAERTRLITAMISSPHQDEEDVLNLAALLGADVDAKFAVIGCERGFESEIRRVAQACAASGQASHVHPHGPISLLFVEHRSDDLSALRNLLEGTPSVIAPLTHGVRSLRRSCLMVIESIHLELATGPGPIELSSHWLQLTAARAWKTLPEMSLPIHRSLDQLRSVEAERLVATALVYASCGSIAETAELTFCHRNTVMTRLRRLAEITGYDITVPADAACLQLALLARPDFRKLQPTAAS